VSGDRYVLRSDLSPAECEMRLRERVEPFPALSVAILDDGSVFGQVSGGRFRFRRGGQRGLSKAVGRLSENGAGTRINVRVDTALAIVLVEAVVFAVVWLLVLGGLVTDTGGVTIGGVLLLAVATTFFAAMNAYFLWIGRRDKAFYAGFLMDALDAVIVRGPVPL
jgi:hypothetical protein